MSGTILLKELLITQKYLERFLLVYLTILYQIFSKSSLSKRNMQI